MDVSTVSDNDYIKLAATVKRTDPNYNCTSARQELERKVQSLYERNAPEHIIKHAIEQKDSAIDKMCNTSGISIVVDNIVFDKCLCNYTIPNFSEIMVYYNNYLKGNLPFPGSVSEQPAQIIEIFNILEHLHGIVQNDREKESK